MSQIQSVPSGYQAAVIQNVQVAINQSTGALLVDTSAITPVNPTGMAANQVTVTGTGAAVQCASHTCKQMMIIGSTTGSAVTLYGFSSAGCQITLAAGVAVVLPVANTNQIWINATAAATVYYVYFN